MKPHVLIIEDDPDIREALAEFLEEEEGFSVTVAENGQQGLERLRSGTLPDVVLLDLMMPVMDGAQFRTEQLQDPLLTELPIIILSADGRLHDFAQQMRVQRVLRKPFDPGDLAQLLRVAIRESATSTAAAVAV